ncbi:anti-sigma factor family protein [Tautonia sociabilis]|uniref:Putative zinc-finger domain-containing protein n=1 Tax=Tautonia sociabilis TaxID=2080755 RepID=A0A432ML34_9BACT|nr:zf-HC2 domain-containing protein [Tautonia sociabilis]RUL87969.1 hypothetical protein TsocGM_09610 [Tautonia sociabilis]
MTCDEARRHWNLYHDSEGDAELHLQVGEHLATCPDCARWFHQESRLEHLIAEKLRAGPETPELWARVLAGSGLDQRAAPTRHWVLVAGVAACAATLAAIAWLGPWASAPDPGGADLAELTAAWHERLVDGRESVPFRSRSDLEVERYLRRRVSFPVRCPPRRDAGFAVRGTGVCALADRPAAYLVGEVGDSPVSIFVLPRESLDAFPHQRDAIHREGTHRCRQGPYEMAMAVVDRNIVLVVGRAEPGQLLRILDAYGSYHEAHPSGRPRHLIRPEDDKIAGEMGRGRLAVRLARRPRWGSTDPGIDRRDFSGLTRAARLTGNAPTIPRGV